MKFSELLQDQKLASVLESRGFSEASPVQEKVIPLLFKGESALIKAPTGSGKTLSYVIPVLLKLDENLKKTQAVIIVPTSLLCSQVEKVFSQFSPSYKNFRTRILVKKEGKEENEKYDEEVLIATPDQFLLNFPSLNISKVSYLIVDEGDMIIFGGFEEQLNEILSLNWGHASRSLFSASVDEQLKTLVRRFIGAEHTVDLSEGEINTRGIRHYLVDIRHQDKGLALVDFLKYHNVYKGMVFVSKKEDLNQVLATLKKHHLPCLSISGDMKKREQMRVYREFNEGKVSLLVATDIAARGVDIPDVSDVISLDLPRDILYYFHRAGRAGRFYKEGNSYVFYNNDDTKKARELINRGVDFTYMALTPTGLKEERTLSKIEKKPERNNVYLEKLIKQKLSHLRGKEVRPNYKKKRRKAIALAKSRHKDDVIKRNIERRNEEEGTHYSFVRMDNPYARSHPKRKRKSR